MGRPTSVGLGPPDDLILDIAPPTVIAFPLEMFSRITGEALSRSPILRRLLVISAAASVDLAAQTPGAKRLLILAPADVLVICLYFALVLGIGLYLKRRVRASKDFFFAGKAADPGPSGCSGHLPVLRAGV